MGQPLQLVLGLLACLALASALPGLFPRDKITKYIYNADVKAGTIEPIPYASQFALFGDMYVKPEFRIPNEKNAYYVFFNVTNAIRNGESHYFAKIEGDTLPIPEAARMFLEPFVVVFENNGKVKSVMINGQEPGWSRNMKQSIASMLQLDMSSLHLGTPMLSQAFLTKENTIYGECVVSYQAHRTPGLGEKHFTVTKNMEPMSCTEFNQGTFNSKDPEGCMVEPEEEMSTVSRRVFTIEDIGDDFLINKLSAFGATKFSPWNADSETHWVLANQSMDFDSMVPMDSMTLPEFNITAMEAVNDITFKKSESHFATNAGVDFSYGRHVVNLESLITELVELLGQATDYINENNLEMTSPEINHGQTMNRILHTMTRMDLPSLEHVFNNIAEGTTPREDTIKNLFLHVVPYVGTNATCLFMRNIIRKHKIPDIVAITMLTKLPHNIRVRSDWLLSELEPLINLGSDTSLEVRKAGILAFATLIYKTHGHESQRTIMESEPVKRYAELYFQRLMNATNFDMAMVYMHALRNIKIGGLHTLLEPIIRGEVNLTDRPEHMRFHAMFFNWRMGRDFEYIHNLYWPILADTELPLLLRLCAYAVLVEHPERGQIISLYWFMVSEKNEHLYNFHYTFLVSLSNSKNPCLAPMAEKFRHILRYTRVRPTSGLMTGIWQVDFVNKQFGFGDSMGVIMAADDHTGVPVAATFTYSSLNKRKPVNELMFYVRVEGVDGLNNIMWNMTSTKADIAMEEIRNILDKSSKDMPGRKPIHIEYSIMIQGRTVMTNFFNKIPDISNLRAMGQLSTDMKLIWETVTFDELWNMQVSNDLGLPTVFSNYVPRVISLKATNKVISQTSPLIAMKFEALFKDSRHGFHSMEVYNPMLDCWHAIRRESAFDASIPMAMTLSYNLESKSIKMSLPRHPLTEYSISGIRSYVTNKVMVVGAEDGLLERYCGTNCRSTEEITRGLENRKNTTIMNLDSKDTGLRFSVHQYNCERIIVPKTRFEEAAEMLSLNDKSTWGNNAVLAAMILRESYLRLIISPELGTCGFIAKLEPSPMYSISKVDLSLRMNLEVPASKILSMLPATRMNFRGTLDAQSIDTNTSVQSWSMTANMGTSQGFANYQGQVVLKRITPGQKNLKICIDAYKIYPAQEVDPLARDSTTKQEVMGKLTFTMGESENGTCVRDDVSVMINMKAEMSSEQKDVLSREMANGACKKDIENPKYLCSESSMVPRTIGCFKEALLRTTLRKYTYTIISKNIPESTVLTANRMFNDFRAEVLNDPTYLPAHTEPGIIKIFVDFPLRKDVMNFAIRTPTHEERYTDISGTELTANPVIRTGVDYVGRNQTLQGVARLDYGSPSFTMLNTQFPLSFLDELRSQRMKFCVVYPNILMNGDGAVMDYTVPGQWTLLSGDYTAHTFSVFAKRLEPKKLGLLMSIRNHTLEVIPSETIPSVKVDGEVIDHVNGVTITEDGGTEIMRLTWRTNRLIVQLENALCNVEWTGRSITLALKTELEGKITGVCGHLDGTHTERMAKTYSFGQ